MALAEVGRSFEKTRHRIRVIEAKALLKFFGSVGRVARSMKLTPAHVRKLLKE